MLCLVSEFLPLSKHSVNVLQDQHDATAALVDDAIWSIFSEAASDTKTEVQQDALTFTCSRGCSFDDFCSMFDDVFGMYEVDHSQGELRALLHIHHSSFFISTGILKLVRFSVERPSKPKVIRLHHILHLLNAVDRTLGAEGFGSGFPDVRGSVEALYLENCSVKASFISKPMMTCGFYLGCDLHFLFIYKLLQNRG